MEKLEPIPLPKSEEEEPVKKRDFYVLTASVNEIIEWIGKTEDVLAIITEWIKLKGKE